MTITYDVENPDNGLRQAQKRGGLKYFGLKMVPMFFFSNFQYNLSTIYIEDCNVYNMFVFIL
jgi:hypothetical protein